MKTNLNFLGLSLLLSIFLFPSPGAAEAQGLAIPNRSQLPTPLLSKSFSLAEAMEVGLEIEARSPGASWERKGSEAAALIISVDGSYNQDLLLWSGDESSRYRVMLGRLPKGRHTVSVALNPERSAAGA
jgi:hypothetical protein